MSNDFSLSQATEAFIQQQVAVGAFRDRTDAIEAGVDLLRQRQVLIDRLSESRRQLDEGEFVEFGDEELDQFFELMLANAEARSKSQ